jgi:hypothetical protein
LSSSSTTLEEARISMSYNQSLADRVHKLLAKRRGFEEKRMFGGMGFLLRGNMCVGVWKEWLIVRLGVEAAATAIDEVNVVPFDITGTPLKGWAMIEPDGIVRDEQLREWVERAEAFVSGLPAKAAKRKKTTQGTRAKKAVVVLRERKGRSARGK